jgi:hypothetical protein
MFRKAATVICIHGPGNPPVRPTFAGARPSPHFAEVVPTRASHLRHGNHQGAGRQLSQFQPALLADSWAAPPNILVVFRGLRNR